MGKKTADVAAMRGPFYGAHSNRFKIGRVVYEAIEDEDDGYRSMMDDIVISSDQSDSGFFDAPLDTVSTRAATWPDDAHGFEVVGSDGHVWLRMGTEHVDDYYPMFVFEYLPKAPPEVGERQGLGDESARPDPSCGYWICRRNAKLLNRHAAHLDRTARLEAGLRALVVGLRGEVDQEREVRVTLVDTLSPTRFAQSLGRSTAYAEAADRLDALLAEHGGES